jgi:demethylmenaquinone methyltransferase/2-methoxy-6-polyprenyl-1,4-benzoquinol methylase
MTDAPTNPPAWDSKLLRDPHAVADKRERVRKMFAAIAPSYDLNNRLHSLWQDQRWRRKAVKLARVTQRDVVVDVACGTGDLTIAFASQLIWKIPRHPINMSGYRFPPDARIIGIDYTYEMLPLARAKRDEWLPPGYPRGAFSLLNADAQSLPLPDACCDVVSIAFGIRNVQDPAAALREFRRVLRPGGRAIVLEFSLPTNRLLHAVYNFYFRQILPRTATLISGDKTGAYRYLPESVNTFITRDRMVQMMGDAGFENVEQFPMTFGVCVCYRGIRSGP